MMHITAAIHIPSGESLEQRQDWPRVLLDYMEQPLEAWLAPVGGTMAAAVLVLTIAGRYTRHQVAALPGVWAG